MIVSAFVACAAFGSFWGAWGASVPRVQHQAGIGHGQLGFALLFALLKVDAPPPQRYDVAELFAAPIGTINGVNDSMT